MEKKIPVVNGQIIKLEIKGITHQGWGVGRIEGFAIFVPNALPGEMVQARIKQVKKSFAMADVVEIMESSAKRVDPPCAVYDSCGGCQIQHANYKEQLEIKHNLVVDNLTRIGKLSDVTVHPVIGMDEPWAYRNNVQFHLESKNEEVEIGFYRPGTHQLVSVEQCHLLPDIFNEIKNYLKGALKKFAVPIHIPKKMVGLQHVVLRISRATGEIIIVLVTSEKKLGGIKKLVTNMMEKFPQIVSVVQNINTRNTSEVFGDKWYLLEGKEWIEDKIGENVFSISPASFAQVNPVQTEKLYAKALEYAELKGHEQVIDVYCGMGTIALSWARKAEKVFGIEEVKEAVKDAKNNATLNNISNIEFFAGKAEKVLPKMVAEGITAHVIVVDPPRKGCDPAVLEAMVKMNPEKIVYVSCDPGTLARDLRLLNEKGYKALEIQPVDMFPQTGHVETVVLMSRVEK